MKRKTERRIPSAREIVFREAIEPLEAAVLPARERLARYGTLAMIPRAYDAAQGAGAQREKIWVR